jgi:nucleotide-binding universal stress UspA family protein
MLTTILVPLDGSVLAERAIPYAVALARKTQARLLLMRAVLAHPPVDVPLEEAQAAVIERAEVELAAVAARVRDQQVTVDAVVHYDDAAPGILAVAEEQGADLLVMSTLGRGGIGRWIYGSVADEVLRHATVPVLLVSASCERGWPTEAGLRVLVPLDGSELAEVALGPAREIAAGPGAGLSLLRAVQPLAYTEADGAAEVLRLQEEVELADASRYLEDVAARQPAGLEAVSLHTVVGQPATQINEIARGQRVDLIAMATHGRGGLARLVLGSVATNVLQHTNVPLLLVRPSAIQQSPRRDSEEIEITSTAPLTSVALTAQEVDLVEQGLAALLWNAEREAGGRVRTAPGAQTVQELLARLEQTRRDPGRRDRIALT